MANEMALTKDAKNLTRFDVEIETASGMPLVVMQDVVAQTKKEAINICKQRLTFTAERCKK